MRIRKIVLSVIAFLLLSLCFLGVNAENADFSYYPLNLFHDGVFNGFIVIGDDAAPDDVIGAVEVGMSLQYAAGEKDMFILPELIRELPGSYKFDKTGNHFSGSIDSIADIQQILGDDELPVILADGRYSDSEGETENDETYQQTIRFFDHATSTVVKRYQPKGRAAGSYMKIDDANATYLYSLEFDNPIYYTNTSTSGQRPSDDLEDTMIKIQGKDYTITHVTDKGALGSYAIDSITLMAGDTLVWLQQGKTLFVTIAGIGHEIEVADVNDLEDMCGVSVDGDVAWLKKGES
ncbi:MAG: hypothetical protein KKE20_01510, partial [Nanoarchaeota archaeon]|nr:hypothetical protein [Nanoarchaeota archaeon]